MGWSTKARVAVVAGIVSVIAIIAAALLTRTGSTLTASQLKVATITTAPMAVDLLKFSCKSATSKHPIVRHRGRNLELIYDLRQPCLATADFGTAGHKEYPLEIHHIRAQFAIARQERWDQGAGVFGNDVVKVAMLIVYPTRNVPAVPIATHQVQGTPVNFHK